jgi:hypothetical protein
MAGGAAMCEGGRGWNERGQPSAPACALCRIGIAPAEQCRQSDQTSPDLLSSKTHTGNEDTGVAGRPYARQRWRKAIAPISYHQVSTLAWFRPMELESAPLS